MDLRGFESNKKQSVIAHSVSTLHAFVSAQNISAACQFAREIITCIKIIFLKHNLCLK